ncbi:MAG: hypothetical protein EA396_00165, partial [Anaerolineaceae bacterium]
SVNLPIPPYKKIPRTTSARYFRYLHADDAGEGAADFGFGVVVGAGIRTDRPQHPPPLARFGGQCLCA